MSGFCQWIRPDRVRGPNIHPRLRYEINNVPMENTRIETKARSAMQDAYVLSKWKLYGLMLITALFGMLVGARGRR